MLNTKQQQFVKYAYEKFGKDVLTKKELVEANKHFGCKYAPQWITKNKDYKVGKGEFKLPVDGSDVSVVSKKVDACNLNELFTVCMWVFCTSFWPNIINKTSIIAFI